MKPVYIAHPLRGNVDKNIESITAICEEIHEQGEVIPFSPIHAFGFVNPVGDQTLVMKYCLMLLLKAEELWVYGDWQQSEGCCIEVGYARSAGIPIKFMGGMMS
ncbi:DUF4406 domain-containing protein [Sporomusa malonica]|uniref:DUF7768 domain-containing protein n=1 Tax=Sporomusa malonica TaxID=112901 RepID=A0A1W2ATG6_9FIRM|nr:DUF4406 domain-containing protein [Sporomusa malonica]SMC64003.1 protein of unknown function [Sporomusa malonica]